MKYSIIKTTLKEEFFGEVDPRNYCSFHHQIMDGGESLKEARAKAMRIAYQSTGALLSNDGPKPTSIALVWHSDTQLDLQVANLLTDPYTCETYVIQEV